MTDIKLFSQAIQTIVDSVNIVGRILEDKRLDFTDIPLGLQLASRFNELARTNFVQLKGEILDLSTEEVQELLAIIGKQIDLPAHEQSAVVKTVIVELSSALMHVKELYVAALKIKAAV